MTELFFNVGDTLPEVEATLSDAAGPLDLTDCTVTLEARVAGTTVSVPCSVATPATGGVVTLRPTVALTAAAGRYPARFKVVTDGGFMHVPNSPGEFVIVHVSGAGA